MSEGNLKMMDGTSTSRSYIVLGDDGYHQIGIQLQRNDTPTSITVGAVLRAAVKPEAEPVESFPNWEGLFPDIDWEVQSESRARTRLHRVIRGLSVVMPERLEEAFKEHGDFIYKPILDAVYAKIPSAFVHSPMANSPDEVYAYIASTLVPALFPKVEFGEIEWAPGSKAQREEESDEEVPA